MAALACFLLMAPSMSYATKLIYTPVNPAFGGEAFNGTFLIETARDQNRYRQEQQPFPDINIPDFDFSMPPIIIMPEAFVPQVED
jgi:hypothetical protein